VTALSGDQLRRVVDGTFVGPVAHRHDPPSIAVTPVDWNAYDVPRLWDALRHEADELAWTQAHGFENLAQLLLSQHEDLQRLRDDLAGSWDPRTNLSAVNVFLFLDELIAAMAEDAVAHACTSRGLYAILTALTTAKDHIEQIKRRWDSVTTDWVPEWWDHEAENLNTNARQIIAAADKTSGDHRQQITIPALYEYPEFVSHLRPPPPELDLAEPDRGGETGTAAGSPIPTGGVQLVPPPPVPGYEPVLARSPQLQSLAGVPQLVPAVPGSPISLLPVPPGHPYAPAGGAYVLPGPGIGRGGWIYPMPASPSRVSPAPAASVDGQGRGQRPARRHGELVWEVAKGVPQVIGSDPPSVGGQASQLPEAHEMAFVEWFADVATPWADDLTIEIRRPEEPSP
jgi:hypothetical protein